MTDNHTPIGPPTNMPQLPPLRTTAPNPVSVAPPPVLPMLPATMPLPGMAPPAPAVVTMPAPPTQTCPRALRLRGAVRHVFDERFEAPAVALVGPNGSGKTSREIAVALPLEGSRHGGGDVKDLVPVGMDFAYSAVDFSDGTSYQFDTRVEWRKIEGAPEVVRPATWLVAKGKAGVLAEVVSRWGGAEAVTALASPDSLTAAQKKFWDVSVAAIRRSVSEEKRRDPSGDHADDPATILGMLDAMMNSLKLTKGKEVKGFAASVAATAQEEMTGVEDEPRVTAALAYARRWDNSARDRDRAVKLQAATTAYQQALAEYNALAPLADRVPVRERYELSAKTLAAEEVAQTFYYEMIRRLSAEGEPLLPGVPFEAIAGFSRFDLYNTALNAWRSMEQSVAEVRASRDRASAELAELDEAQKWRDAHRDRLGAEYARIVSETKELTVQLAGLDHVPTETVAVLEKKLDDIKAAAERKRVRAKIVDQKAKAEEDLRNIKAVGQAAQIAYSGLAALVQGRLNNAVTARLPLQYQDRFHFDLAKGRLEMRGNDGRPHDWRNQGGGEYVSLTLALGRAWSADRRAVLLLEYERDLAALSSLPGPNGEPSVLATVLHGLAEAAYSGEIAMVMVASPVALPLDSLWQTIETRPPIVTATAPAAPMPQAPAPQGLPAAFAAVANPSHNQTASIPVADALDAEILVDDQTRAPLPMPTLPLPSGWSTGLEALMPPMPTSPTADADLESRLRAMMPPMPDNVIPFGPPSGGSSLGGLPPIGPPSDGASQIALPSMDSPAPLPLADAGVGASFLTNEPPPLPLRSSPSGMIPPMSSMSSSPTRRVLDSMSARDELSDADRAALAALHGGDDADASDDGDADGSDDADADSDDLAAAAARAVKSKRRKKSPASTTRSRKKK